MSDNEDEQQGNLNIQFGEEAETGESLSDMFTQPESTTDVTDVEMAVVKKPASTKKQVSFGADTKSGLSPEEEEKLKALMPNYDETKSAFDSKKSIADLNQMTTHIKGQNFLSTVREEKDQEDDIQEVGKVKFGTWDGVFVSCLLNIFGVIMFLRLPWVVGQAGVLLTISIILLAGVVTTLTTMSMSAIATNGTIKAGGAYYMISRSLGPQVGGSVGMLFSFGNGVAVALYLIGFCETLSQGIGPGVITGNDINDIRLIGCGMIIICLVMVLIGVGWIIKVQLALFALLLCSIGVFVVGAFNPKPATELGFVGFDEYQDPNANTTSILPAVLAGNMLPDFQVTDGIQYDYFKVFAVFFPAVTGIMAGANISGDLKDPSVAIPKGTLSAIALSTVVYCILTVFLGAVCSRDALLNNPLIIADVSGIMGPVVLAGIYAATFSSALASLVGGPRILQKVAEDNILPFLLPFAKLNNKGDPVRGYYLVFIIGVGCILVGKLNLIAPLISMFFLMTYALVNYACFEQSRTESPGWRPSFKYFHTISCFFGFILCVVAMFLTDALYAGLSSVVLLGLYKYIEYVDPKVNWGSAPEARRDMNIVKDLLRRKNHQTNIKNFRPNYLILVRHAEWNDSSLMKFGSTLRQGHGLEMYGHVVIGDAFQFGTVKDYVDVYKVNGNLGYIDEHTVTEKNSDNKSTSSSSERQWKLDAVKHASSVNVLADVENAINTLVDESDRPDGIDAEELQTRMLRNHAAGSSADGTKNDSLNRTKGAFMETVIAKTFRDGANSLMQVAGIGNVRPNTLVLGYPSGWKDKKQQKELVDEWVGVVRDAFNFHYHIMIVRGTSRVNWAKDSDTGSIDVWWLVDDGGMAVLLGYILNKADFWSAENTHVRLFAVGDKKRRDTDHKEITELLAKFRLYWEVTMVALDDEVSDETMLIYDQVVSVTPFAEQRKDVQRRTKKWMLTAQALKKHSRRAKLIVVTLPYARSTIANTDYMSWLEVLTKDFRDIPVVMIRGNGDDVLTSQSE